MVSQVMYRYPIPASSILNQTRQLIASPRKQLLQTLETRFLLSVNLKRDIYYSDH